MKRLGVVENISYDGSILVRSDFAPIKGSVILDGRNKEVGKVWKVFGPVRKPFTSIRPSQKPPLSLIGSVVYLEEGKYARKKLKKGRRG